MKLLIHRHHPGRPQHQQGMAVIVVIALLSIIFLYVMANARTLHYLKRDLRLVEQQQTNRLHSWPAIIPGADGAGATSAPSPAGGQR